jgi:hypothetical protein
MWGNRRHRPIATHKLPSHGLNKNCCFHHRPARSLNLKAEALAALSLPKGIRKAADQWNRLKTKIFRPQD